MNHRFNGSFFEQDGQQIVTLIIAMQMKIHVPVNCRKFVGYSSN
jgi:hypothetical protein